MTTKQKQLLLAFLGYLPAEGVDGIWGSQSAGAAKNFQADFGIEADGIPGPNTENALRNAVACGMPEQEAGGSGAEEGKAPAAGSFWEHIRFWRREEFGCRCGEYHEPYCSGFPAEPDQTLVELLDDIRAHFGRPAHRSSGLRCKQHNADSKGVANSKHLYGKAMDFFIEGVSGEAVRSCAAADPRCNYTYVIQGNYVHVDVR